MTTKYLLLVLYLVILLGFQAAKQAYRKTQNKTYLKVYNILRFASLLVIVLLLKYM